VIVMTKEPKPNNSLLLEMRQIDKSFPGVHALKKVSVKLHRGEVLGLAGGIGSEIGRRQCLILNSLTSNNPMQD
jgi:ABC-type transporter Mla maintaining outer membrane lipid asymmetry ATPase subunit MlaF